MRNKYLSWDTWYEMACNYYNHHGNLNIKKAFKSFNGYDFDENGFNLGQWIQYQRRLYKTNCLDEHKIDLLNKIGITFKIYDWNDSFNLAKNFYNHYGNFKVPTDFRTKDGINYSEDGIFLDKWLQKQRSSYKKDKLDKNKIELLNSINFFEYDSKRFVNWDKMYDLAVNYYNRFNNLDMPTNFKTFDGVNYDENGYNLDKWLKLQRTHHNSGYLKDERYNLLLSLGFNFKDDDANKRWNYMYDLAKKYYEHYGNLEVKYNFKTKDGVNYYEEGEHLYNWILAQRKFYRQGRLKKERIDRLNSIDMRFNENKSDLLWFGTYNILKNYHDYYGDLNIPVNFKTINGIDYDANGVNLYVWMKRQLYCYENNMLKEYRKNLLENIGIMFTKKVDSSLNKNNDKIPDNIYDKRWQEYYELAKKYYDFYGSLKMKIDFSTYDGINYDKNGFNLYNWVGNQKKAYKYNYLKKERITLLEKIGIVWICRNDEWEKNYQIAKMYYNQHNNINIPVKSRVLINNDKIELVFKNDKGFDKAIPLGTWLNHQRQALRKTTNLSINEERIRKLNSIGMIWDFKKNKDEIIFICEQFGIDYNKNKKIIDRMSIQELSSKIDYLTDNNIPIIINGKLHEIFSMSSINMYAKYDVTLEYLLNKYYNKNKNKGV